MMILGHTQLLIAMVIDLVKFLLIVHAKLVDLMIYANVLLMLDTNV